MNLKELKEKVDFYFQHSHIDPEEVNVLITLSNPSIGSRASTTLDSVYLGFDWENGQLRLGTNEPIYRKEPEFTNKWWGYEHVNKTIHVKRFFTQEEFNSSVESPFVLRAVGPFEAKNRADAIEILKNKLK